MDTDNEGLSSDNLMTAGDPISCRQAFWDALVIADEGLAIQATKIVRPPPVTVQTFNFSEEGELIDELDEDKFLTIELDSLIVVLNAWNNPKKTGLVVLNYDSMCLCKSEARGGGKLDFRACVTADCRLLSH